ncbi:hypothetical protein HWV62_21804 [Athelia sp. TMB]|nr:hypothetical protein HWV62_21804 [Athelia sp. TMB]
MSSSTQQGLPARGRGRGRGSRGGRGRGGGPTPKNKGGTVNKTAEPGTATHEDAPSSIAKRPTLSRAKRNNNPADVVLASKQHRRTREQILADETTAQAKAEATVIAKAANEKLTIQRLAEIEDNTQRKEIEYQQYSSRPDNHPVEKKLLAQLPPTEPTGILGATNDWEEEEISALIPTDCDDYPATSTADSESGDAYSFQEGFEEDEDDDGDYGPMEEDEVASLKEKLSESAVSAILSNINFTLTYTLRVLTKLVLTVKTRTPTGLFLLLVKGSVTL